MKKIFSLASLAFLIFSAIATLQASSRAHSYIKKSGMNRVQAHHRSSKDKIRLNNWSAKGNVNPYTGKKGHKRLR